MKNRYFILPNFKISNELYNDILSISKDNFRFYGARRKRLYMCSVNLSVIPNLQEILDQLYDPSIVDNYEIMYTEPGAIVMPHIDSRRRVALNIPIKGEFEKSYVGIFEKQGEVIANTEFFDTNELVKEGGGYPASKLIDKVTYTQPICLNTEEVHNVVNLSNKDRIVLGLGFDTKLSFADIEKMHEQNKLVLCQR
jgi:hypothetical protein